MISVVSISTVIAGWFWNKRQRLRRLGFGAAKKPKGRA
jgi:hypothetical protein